MDVRYKPFQKCIQFLKVFNFSFYLPSHPTHYYVFINFISLLFFNSLGSGVLEFEASHEALTTGLHSSLELPPRAV